MGTEKNEPTAQSGEEALSFAAVARRRMLLKGAGKGVAIMAATVPIQTLAGQSLLTVDVGSGRHQCSVSGMQSGVHSATPTGTTPTCTGYSPSRYATLSFWPGYAPGNNPPSTARATNTVDGITFTDNSTFSLVFGSGSSNGPTARLLAIVTSGSPEPEQVWVTALLNAFKNATVPSLNFPYTPAQVRAFYSSPQAAQALSFFRTYMQTA